MQLSDCTPTEREALQALGQRIGPELVSQRLRREGSRAPAPHLSHRLIRAGLRFSGLRSRGRRNLLDIQVRHNEVRIGRLPFAFDGFTLLHVSDPHLDMDLEFQHHLVARLQGLTFDACVLTGDFRFHGFGPYQGVLDALEALRPHLGEQVQAVLGNHDTIRMVPGMEARGFPVLMNEAVLLRRDAATLVLAGIDDAHYFRTHDVRRALAHVPPKSCVVLLSHTPEPYRLVEHAGVQLMLSGHTHGGQVCLPGGIPVMTETPTPRAYVRGPWQYRALAGYTSVGCGASVVDVRFNCLPEITLHRLRCA
jgi:hypothetical protein